MQASYNSVWITGASSGIGRELALMYAAKGCTVYASARNEKHLSDLVESAEIGTIVSCPLDVTDAQSINALVTQLSTSNQLPDLAVLNAGFYEPVSLPEFNDEHINKIFNVNYLGVTGCLTALLPHYINRQSGHIAVVASVAGYAGLPQAAAYGSSKAALINLCESLKPEFDKHKLHLSLVNPGFVKTEMTDKNSFEMPFLISTDTAATRIISGIEKNKFEINFPRRFTWLMKLLRLLPYSIFFLITRRLIRSD